jgi:hypothetical protein
MSSKLSSKKKKPVTELPPESSATPEFINIESDLTSFEPRFYAIVVAPIQRFLPRSVSPNTITLASLACSLAFGAAAVAGVAAGPGTRDMLIAHIVVFVLQITYTVRARARMTGTQ